jgi:Domain of unknown function (DUF5979)
LPDRRSTPRPFVRRTIGALAALVLVTGTVVALAAPAFAGGNMHVEVNLVVVGTAPAGTTFTVHYDCSPGGLTGDLSFDAAGNPAPANSNFFNDGTLNSTCTLTETANGGAASVGFQCVDDGVNATCASPTSNQVTFDSPTNLSNNVTFTITNTFVEAAPVIEGTPSFTG